MQLISSAFNTGEAIPVEFTKLGSNTSPPLKWFDVPEYCKSLVLICEDLDSPRTIGKDYPFVHWLLYNISPRTHTLPAGIAPKRNIELASGAKQGRNSFGEIGYGGPLPPEGKERHRYEFTLYALNYEINLPVAVRRGAVVEAVAGHSLAVAKLTGVFSRTHQEPQTLPMAA